MHHKCSWLKYIRGCVQAATSSYVVLKSKYLFYAAELWASCSWPSVCLHSQHPHSLTDEWTGCWVCGDAGLAAGTVHDRSGCLHTSRHAVISSTERPFLYFSLLILLKLCAHFSANLPISPSSWQRLIGRATWWRWTGWTGWPSERLRWSMKWVC